MAIEDGGAADNGNETPESLRDKLSKQERRLWHKLEILLVRHAMKLAQSPAVVGPDKLLDVVEEFRVTAHEIAEGIRELTMIIRQEILLEKPDIAADALAASVDTTLKERIEFNFRPVTPEIDEGKK